MHVGRVEKALALVRKELTGIEQSGAHQAAAQLHRLKGEAVLMSDSSATAQTETCYRKAVEIARGKSAKWWELRATVSLARLLRDSIATKRVRCSPKSITWFRRRFDTADLKDAKSLLQELAG
jgi:hypothetical protein